MTTNDVIQSTLTDFLTIKVIASFLFGLFAFFFGDAYSMGILAILMLLVLDTVTGTWAAVHEGQTISSKRMGSVVKKFIVYGIAISTGYYMDIAISIDLLFAQATIIGFIALTEGISILENASRLGLILPPSWLKKLKDLQAQQ